MQGFGGIAAGPGPLKRLHEDINNVLKPLIGKPITITAIVDVMNLIGRCVGVLACGLASLLLTVLLSCVAAAL